MMKHLSLDRRIQSLFPVALASLLVIGTARLVLDNLKSDHSQIFRLYGWPRGEKHRLPIVLSPKDRIEEKCNVFEGKWVWDNVSYPHYTEESCPFLVKQVTCHRNGRPDSYYKNWRWQPNGCNLPRYTPFVYHLFFLLALILLLEVEFKVDQAIEAPCKMLTKQNVKMSFHVTFTYICFVAVWK